MLRGKATLSGQRSPFEKEKPPIVLHSDYEMQPRVLIIASVPSRIKQKDSAGLVQRDHIRVEHYPKDEYDITPRVNKFITLLQKADERV